MGLAPQASIEEFVNITVSSILSNLMYNIPYTPTYLEGSAGAGKSSSIEYIRKALKSVYPAEGDIGYFQFKAGTQTAQELWGVPFPIDINDNGRIIKVSKYLKNEDFPGIVPSKTPKIGIFHIDELTSVVDDQIKAAITELVLEGRMADYELPQNWYVVCTGNERRDGNTYNKLPFPLRNRLRIMKIVSEKEGWLRWAERNDIDATIVSFIANSLSTEEFLTFNPDLEDDGDDVDPNNYVASTYRSWDQVDKIIRTHVAMKNQKYLPNVLKIEGCADITLSNTRELQINFQSILGKDLGTKFFDFYMSTYGIDIQRIINMEWEKGEPKESLEIVKNRSQLDYLVAQAKNAKNDLMPTKVIFYLHYCNAPESYITSLQSTLTKSQQDELKRYAIDTNSLNLVSSIIKAGEKLDSTINGMNDINSIDSGNTDLSWK